MMTTNDGIVNLKYITAKDKAKITYARYYKGIEIDILVFLGNEKWYNYCQNK